MESHSESTHIQNNANQPHTLHNFSRQLFLGFCSQASKRCLILTLWNSWSGCCSIFQASFVHLIFFHQTWRLWEIGNLLHRKGNAAHCWRLHHQVFHQGWAWRRPGAQGRPGYSAAIVYSSVKNSTVELILLQYIGFTSNTVLSNLASSHEKHLPWLHNVIPQ